MKIKRGVLNTYLGAIGLIVFGTFLFKYPIFISYILIMSLPGYLVSYLIIKNGIDFIERFLLSIPLSMLFLIPLNWISDAQLLPINNITIIIILIILPIFLSLLNIKYFKKSINKTTFSLAKLGMKLFTVAIILAIVFFMWSPLLQGSMLPLSDAVVTQAFILNYVEGIQEANKIPLWTTVLSGGYPISLFDSYFYYERVATIHILTPSTNITFDQNSVSFIAALAIGLGIFCLAKRFGMNSFLSILSVIFFMINPFLANKYGYSGDMKEFFGFSLFPIMLILFIIFLKKKQHLKVVALIAAMYYFSHSIGMAVHAFILILFFLLYKVILDKRITLSEAKGLVGFGMVFFLLILFNLIPFVLNSEYTSPEEWGMGSTDLSKDIRDNVIMKMFKDAVPGRYTNFTGKFFTLLGILGIIVLVFKDRANLQNILLLSFVILVTMMIILPQNPILGFLTSDRIKTFLVLIFALFIPRIYQLSKRIEFRIILTLVLIVFTVKYATMTGTMINNWVHESSVSGTFKNQYAVLDQRGPGRVVMYGAFSFGLEPIIPFMSENLGMITHTHTVAARTNPQSEFKDGSESKLNLNYNISYILNRMRTTFTKYIFIFKCDPGRQGGVTEQQLEPYTNPPFSLERVLTEQCVTLYEIPKTNYVESVGISQINIPRDDVYAAVEGWKVYGFLEPTDVYDYEINSVDDINKITDPAVYNYNFESQDHLVIFGPFAGEWIIVKDHYFPRWHAYMNDEELIIKESNLGTMLIKTKSGQRIDLINQPFSYELILGFVATLVLIVVLVYPTFAQNIGKK